MPDPDNPPSLAELRKEIDRIDAAMHGLLIERSEIIGRLIATKKSQATIAWAWLRTKVRQC